ncbi:hypothetical protein GCM10018987_20890 [Streptomyces cremeus]
MADIGAGTGIGTSLLHARGARVTAVEPGAGTAAEFRRRLPDVPLVRGNSNQLPLATPSTDFITYAQARHWTDTARSAPEAQRALRPGGALAPFPPGHPASSPPFRWASQPPCAPVPLGDGATPRGRGGYPLLERSRELGEGGGGQGGGPSRSRPTGCRPCPSACTGRAYPPRPRAPPTAPEAHPPDAHLPPPPPMQGCPRTPAPPPGG